MCVCVRNVTKEKKQQEEVGEGREEGGVKERGAGRGGGVGERQRRRGEGEEQGRKGGRENVCKFT